MAKQAIIEAPVEEIKIVNVFIPKTKRMVVERIGDTDYITVSINGVKTEIALNQTVPLPENVAKVALDYSKSCS